MVNTRSSVSQSDLQQTSVTSTSSQATQSGPGVPSSTSRRSESLSQLGSNARDQPRKRSEAGNKDYNKHWLIQEAEQRRISEAKQRQNISPGAEKIENINNNNGHDHQNYPDKHSHNMVSDNIYANVDAANINYNTNPR